MIIYGIAAVIFLLVTFLSTHERIQPIAKEKTSIKDDLKDLSKNTPWILLFIVTILFYFICLHSNECDNTLFQILCREQVLPWLTGFINFFKQHIINPVYSLFGKEQLSLIE